MIFKRRDKLTLLQKIKLFFKPTKGWQRSVGYVNLRMRRIPDTPHRIALGVAIGIFMCFSPLFGIHIALAVALAFAFRANFVSAVAATFLVTPITLPFIVAGCLKLGRRLMGIGESEGDIKAVMDSFWYAGDAIWKIVKSWFGFGEADYTGLTDFFADIFVPYLVGGTILGLVLGAASYFATKPAIAAYKHARYRKMRERREKRRDALKSVADSPAQTD